MGKTLYLECYSGISGDMMVGALLDLGADEKVLEEQLRSLPVEGYSVEIRRVVKSGLDVCDFCVKLDHAHENHDHDTEYLYGHTHRDHHDHTHHNHHTHHDHHDHTHHEHRNLGDILAIIHHSGISHRAKETSERIFTILAEAEAKAHGKPLDQVHFHEVGAVDSIVDIIAAAVCLDNLDIEQVIVPVLYEGRGTIRCQHGVIPVPVPAVANIAGAHGLTLHMTETEAELVTPTGAAVVAAVCTSEQLPEKYRIIKIGMGAGKRDYGRTSVLRAMLIEPEEETDQDTVFKLETDIDDCSGEALGYVMDLLLEAGAKDVHYVPVFMKKNRPAYELTVLCAEDDVAVMEQIIFRETTTIGIRRGRMDRTVLQREIRTVNTSFGEVKVKICVLPEGRRIYPEYDSVSMASKRENLPYQAVWNQIRLEAEHEL